MFVETGQELLTDEARHVAAKAARQGVKVVFEEYEAMPHCFAMLLESLPASRLFFDSWGAFIRSVVDNPGGVSTSGKRVAPKTLEETSVDVKTLSGRSDEEVLAKMRERVRKLSGKVSDPLAKL